MVFAPGQPKIGGRKPGVRNKKTIAARSGADALDYVQMVVATEDWTITPDGASAPPASSPGTSTRNHRHPVPRPTSRSPAMRADDG